MARSWIARQVVADLLVVITDDHCCYGESILSSRVIRGIRCFGFKCERKQRSAGNSNTVGKVTFYFRQLSKGMSFFRIQPSVVNTSSGKNCSCDTMTEHIRQTFANSKCVALIRLHYAKSYRPFELFVNENYML